MPLAQTPVAVEKLGHTRPHAPQLVALTPRSTSQPFDARPSQLPHPASQVKLHAPDAQLADVACAGTGHVAVVYPRPSALQVRRSVVEPQLRAPGLQIQVLQRPLAQLEPEGHDEALLESPSAAQVDTVVDERHDEALGVQT